MKGKRAPREGTAVFRPLSGSLYKAQRHGLEECVSDCSIFLDHRVTEQVATQRLRLIKYRGSRHSHNGYPYTY